MSKNDWPSREEIYQKYIVENLSAVAISEYYHISRAQFQRIARFYGIKKNRSQSVEIRKQTNRERYGVESVAQLPEVRAKIMQTSRDRYGTDFPTQSNEVRERTRQTNLKKYGAVSPAGNAEVYAKMRSACMDHWGVPNPSLAPECVAKRKATMVERFGVECNLTLPEVQQQISQTCLRKYGVPYFCMSDKCIGQNHGSKSQINEATARILEEKGINFERECVIGRYIYDFKIGQVLIELNPTYTHSIDVAYHNKNMPLDSSYHHEKSVNAIQAGFICIHIFDWMDLGGILQDVIEGRYEDCYMQERDIRTYFVKLNGYEVYESVTESEASVLLDTGFVRVCDDGHDIITKIDMV